MGIDVRGVVAVLSCAWALVACSKVRDYGREAREQRERDLAEAGAVAAADASVGLDAGAPVDDRVATSRSFASFRGDVLDECVDMTLIAPPGTEQALVERSADAAFKAPKGTVPIKDGCEDQFADRVVLGRCVTRKDEKRDAGSLTVVLSALYYNVKTTKDSDGYMRDCLSMGGKWTAPSKDDPEAARERARQRAKNLQDLADKMGQAR